MVAANMTERTYEAGSVIHARDHECLGLIRICRGKVRTYLISPEGREITLYRMKSGELDVLSASCVVNQITFDTQMIAETDVKLLVLPATYLSELKEKNLQVRCFIFEQLSGRFSDVMWTMQQTLFSRLDSRIASYLVEEMEGANSTTLSLTHENIAREINSTREVVTRMLKRFAQENIIKSHRGSIEILDPDRLRRV